MTATLTGSILTPGGWSHGALTHGARIDTVSANPVATPAPPYIIPGFVDCHVHGGAGADMMEGPDAMRTGLRLHARHGTTSLCATSVTAPEAELDAFLANVASVMDTRDRAEARVLGAHLEGPFLNPGKMGAQPPFAVAPDLPMMARWIETGCVRIMTFAPEMDPDMALRDMLMAHDIRAQMGHSLCSYAEATAGLLAGCGATHLFNAMSGIAHRENGLAGAVLAHGDWAEIIPDLLHVEPGAILAARRAVPNLYGVTDATAGAGMPDGAYRLGGQTAQKRDGAMRLADGTLAGSALTMDVALRNLVSIGLPLDEAVRRLSTLPADWLGRADIGRVAPGARADLVVLDADLQVVEVRIDGTTVA